MLDRIHDSILAAKGEKSATEILSHLGKGDVDLLNRSQSKAKDLLWELELFAILKEKGLRPVFAEPDIVVEFDGAMVGVACKKLYSETHVQDVLSKAVRQVAGEMDVGIAAVNLDELLPANCIWRSNTLEEAGRKVARHNNGFRTRHSRHIEKYLASGRLVSVLVSTTALADIVFGRAKFANVGDVSYWSLYGLSDEKAQLLKRFYGMVFG